MAPAAATGSVNGALGRPRPEPTGDAWARASAGATAVRRPRGTWHLVAWGEALTLAGMATYRGGMPAQRSTHTLPQAPRHALPHCIVQPGPLAAACCGACRPDAACRQRPSALCCCCANWAAPAAAHGAIEGACTSGTSSRPGIAPALHVLGLLLGCWMLLSSCCQAPAASAAGAALLLLVVVTADCMDRVLRAVNGERAAAPREMA